MTACDKVLQVVLLPVLVTFKICSIGDNFCTLVAGTEVKDRLRDKYQANF